MQQLLAVWNALDMRRRVIVAVATMAMFAAVLGLARVAAQPSMALLYAGLEPGPAGEVIGALEQLGVAMEVRGAAIYVDAARRDELRMTLASEGLPGNSSQGYELLDGLSGFGTTSQMFDAAYWRAKEGELARTIMASPRIKSARVHIAIASSQSFRAPVRPSASVTVTMARDSLPASHARALKFLVASAVPGLEPEDVSVIDTQSGLVMSGDEQPGFETDAGDRGEALKRNVQRLLEARVGHGNAIVEVTVDTVLESEKIFERVFDPESRVAIATETEETSAASSGGGAGAVTVASNLPAGDANAVGDATSNTTETRERVNYEVSETTREVSRGPGAIRRITVAALVDGIRTTSDTGESIWQPRPEDELEALEALVASAVGFDPARGDTITIRSMEFEPLPVGGSEAAPGMFSAAMIDVMSLVRLAVLALVALVLGLFVLRPILTARADAAMPVALPPGPGPGQPEAPPPAISGEIEDGEFPDTPGLTVISDFDFASGTGQNLPGFAASSDPVTRLRALIEERQAETVEILRGWMEDEEEPV